MSDESPVIEFSTTRSLGEVWRVRVAALFLRASFLVCYGSLLLGALFLVMTEHSIYRAYGFFGFGFAIIAPILYCLSVWRSIKINPSVTANVLVSVFPWGIRTKSDVHDVSLTWENFGSVVETRDHIVIRYRKSREGVVLPKRDLEPPQRSTLLSFVSQHLGRR